jgi:hypothetical protein
MLKTYTERSTEFLYLHFILLNIQNLMALFDLSPTPPPGGRGYNADIMSITTFSPGRRWQGDEANYHRAAQRIHREHREVIEVHRGKPSSLFREHNSVFPLWNSV